ncbi:MAG: hypothetical protein L6Q97_26580 [Thermoanaerobaculia bacterium]|nr:hypothetical protein [Thermoanaerobaculia bacterium]
MTIRQQLTLEIEKASPEILVQVLEFLKFLKQQKTKTKHQKNGKHFLDDVIGIMDTESGDEMDKIVNREFQQIEGEW